MTSIKPNLTSKSQALRPTLACFDIPDPPCKTKEPNPSRLLPMNSLESLHGISILQPDSPPRRPMLYLFPRGDPNAPFVPLSTRLTFRIPVKQVEDSDSDSSSLYPSTEEDDDDDEKCSGPLNFKQSTKLSDSSFKIKGILKTSKKSTRTSIPSSSASSLDSSSSILSPESIESHLSSPGPKVRIVEPLDVLGELNELRKSLTYDAQGSRTLQRKIEKPLPAHPKLGLKKGVTIKLVVKAYQRTPPATSSKARVKWISSRGLGLRSLDDSRSVKLPSDHVELESSSNFT